MDECLAIDGATAAKLKLPPVSPDLLDRLAQDICARVNAAVTEMGCKPGIVLSDWESDAVLREAAKAAYSSIALAAGAKPRAVKLKGGVDA